MHRTAQCVAKIQKILVGLFHLSGGVRCRCDPAPGWTARDPACHRCSSVGVHWVVAVSPAGNGALPRRPRGPPVRGCRGPVDRRGVAINRIGDRRPDDGRGDPNRRRSSREAAPPRGNQTAADRSRRGSRLTRTSTPGRYRSSFMSGIRPLPRECHPATLGASVAGRRRSRWSNVASKGIR